MKKQPTVALSLIVKDEFKEVSQIISDAINYVDEINLVVSDKKTADALRTVAKPFKFINVKYRKWNDCFDEARNKSMAMCTTDYMFWIDSDDSFDFTSLRSLVTMAEESNLGAIFLPYNYMYTESGELGARHWRERLIDLSKGYTWRGRVHETLISEENPTSTQVDLPVIHNATFESVPDKIARNHKILELAVQETDDPRYISYLGMSYFSLGLFDKSIETLDKYLQVGQNPDDIYRALATISESCYKLGLVDRAMEYASRCIVMIPEYPMGYWMLAQYESDQDNHREALEWVRVSEIKPDPDTLAIWDPSARNRAIWIAARSLFMMNRFGEAFTELKRIRNSDEAKQVWEDFLDEAQKEKFINILPSIQQFFPNDYTLWNALSDDMKYDIRLRPLRNKATTPKTWNDKSIVIFCGQGFEEWGPQTLDKGMGGSEEAVVYLSKELAKLGYSVTIYAEADLNVESDVPEGVVGWHRPIEWRHWREIDTRDNFNIFVSWRQPAYIEKIKAKVKLVDVHDVLPENIMKDMPDVTYMVKSDYHRSLTPSLPDDKFRIIGNGIAKEQFDENHSDNS